MLTASCGMCKPDSKKLALLQFINLCTLLCVRIECDFEKTMEELTTDFSSDPDFAGENNVSFLAQMLVKFVDEKGCYDSLMNVFVILMRRNNPAIIKSLRKLGMSAIQLMNSAIDSRKQAEKGRQDRVAFADVTNVIPGESESGMSICGYSR